jgi:hypothetical protein
MSENWTGPAPQVVRIATKIATGIETNATWDDGWKDAMKAAASAQRALLESINALTLERDQLCKTIEERDAMIGCQAQRIAELELEVIEYREQTPVLLDRVAALEGYERRYTIEAACKTNRT